MRTNVIVLALALVLGACGEDEGTSTQQQGQARPAPAVAPRPGAGSGKGLATQAFIEGEVACPIDDLTMEKPCDPKAPSCGPRRHCLQASNGWFCGSCPERDAIRHVFKPRDFVAASDTRDPFHSFLIAPGVIGSESGLTVERTEKCVRKDQFRATNYSYQDLRLVGIVARGTQRKVLMLDATNYGHIIKRGDCVGKEKALVKEIGAGYVTFVVTPDQTPGADPKDAEEHSVQLYPTQVSVTDQIESGSPPRTTITPVVAPPPTLPPKP